MNETETLSDRRVGIWKWAPAATLVPTLAVFVLEQHEWTTGHQEVRILAAATICGLVSLGRGILVAMLTGGGG